MPLECPCCKLEFTDLRTLAQHIAYSAFWADFGMGKKGRNIVHKKWLEEKGLKPDYHSVKEYLMSRGYK